MELLSWTIKNYQKIMLQEKSKINYVDKITLLNTVG